MFCQNTANLDAFLTSKCTSTWEFGNYWKKVESNGYPNIKKQLLLSNHSPKCDDFFILNTNNNGVKVTLRESLLLNRDFSPLNNN